jgi:hypothetical protein
MDVEDVIDIIDMTSFICNRVAWWVHTNYIYYAMILFEKLNGMAV